MKNEVKVVLCGEYVSGKAALELGQTGESLVPDCIIVLEGRVKVKAVRTIFSYMGCIRIILTPLSVISPRKVLCSRSGSASLSALTWVGHTLCLDPEQWPDSTSTALGKFNLPLDAQGSEDGKQQGS